MYKITIIYDTRGGNTKKMAEEVGKGVNEIDDVEVNIKHVDESEAGDLLESEGIIVGSPTHCGLLSWKLKKFFDESVEDAWGDVKGKIGAAFSTAGGLGGGNELTAFSILNILMNYGFLVFGLPDYAAPGVTAHYGAVAVGEPGKDEKKSCQLLGKQTAQYVKQMNS